MKRLFWILAVLVLLPLVASGQPAGQLPTIGELMWRSPQDRANVVTGRPLSYSRDSRRFYSLGPNLLSVWRPAESFNLNTATPPALGCDGSGCWLSYAPSGNEVAALDFILPSVPLDGASLLLTWQAAASSGTVRWTVDWCRFRAGEAVCLPNGAHAITTGSVTSGANKRNDLELNPFSPEWEPGDHVVVHITREGAGNTLAGNAEMRGVRLEWTQE